MRRTSRLHTTRRVAMAATALLALLATACGTDTGTGGPSTSVPTATVLPTSAVPASPSAPSTRPGAPSTTTPSGNRCAWVSSWGTDPEQASAQSRDALYGVRVGRHDCFDRVVFDVNGTAPVGYAVRYVPLVHADPSDKPLPVPGRAVLQIVVLAPESGFDDGGRPLAATGDYLYPARQLAGWSTLRAVRFGGFFEGRCTFAVGVRDRLPFRVFTVLDRTGHTRGVVLDVAH